MVQSFPGKNHRTDIIVRQNIKLFFPNDQYINTHQVQGASLILKLATLLLTV